MFTYPRKNSDDSQNISFKDLGTSTQGKQGAIDSREVSGYEQQ